MREFVTGQNLGRWRESGPKQGAGEWLQVVEGLGEVPLRHPGERAALPDHQVHAGAAFSSSSWGPGARLDALAEGSDQELAVGISFWSRPFKVLRQSYFANMPEPDVTLKRLTGTTTSCCTMVQPA